jgi:membrane protein YqaA with SNARE-associated domain
LPTLELSSPTLAFWSAIVTGFVTGVVPIGLAEAAALAIGAVTPPELAVALLAAFTVAHVAGKIGWYWLGTLADRVTEQSPRTHALIVRARAVMDRHPGYGAGVLAAAAVASIPPFHLAAIAAGIARIPFVRFLVICLAGRAVRFALIGAVPSVARLLVG